MMLKKMIFGFLLMVLAQTTFAQTSDDWVKTAIEKKNKQDNLGAIADCNRALQLDGRNTWALNVRGIAKNNLKRYDEAIADYDQALAIDNKYKQVYFNRGIAKDNSGRYAEAIADYDRTLTLDPKDEDAYVNRGLAKSHMGRYAEAVVDYDQAIALNATDPIAFNNRGIAKKGLGRFADAIPDFDRAITLDPKYYVAYNNRGYAYYNVGGSRENYQRAVDDYDKSIELGGSGYVPYYKYRDEAAARLATLTNGTKTADEWIKSAIAKEDNGDNSGAVNDCNNALQINPRSAWAYNVRGVAKKNLKDYAGAAADYDQALAINSKYQVVYFNRGLVKYYLGKYEESILDNDQAILLNPKDQDAYVNRGLAKNYLGRYNDAIVDYDRAIELDPKDYVAYNDRGLAKDNLGRYADAIADYSQSIVNNPKYALAYNNRGVVKNELGRYYDAIQDLDQSIALDDRYARAYNNRGYAYYKIGGSRSNFQKAINDYDKALEVGGSSYSPYHKYRDEAMNAYNTMPDGPVINVQQIFTVLSWVKPGLADLNGDVYVTQSGTLPVWVRINSSQPVDRSNIHLVINGQYQNGDKTRVADLRELVQSKTNGNSSVYQYEYKTTIELPDGMSTYKVVYNNEKTEELKVNYQPSGLNLYVLSIGTHNNNLTYPEKDATDMAALFNNQGGNGKIYRNVYVKQLVGTSATAGNMANQLSMMAGQPYTSNDVLLVFISSHGFVKNNQLKITGSDFSNLEINQTSLDFNDDVLGKLNDVNCKKFIFLDACYSGVATGKDALSLDISKAIETMKGAGTDFTIITSSSNDEKSWEDTAWQNGAFTKAIKEALREGKADANNDHIVTVDELYNYISKQVPAMVSQVKNEQQHPRIHNRKGDVPIYVY
jgi:tetratricopeptide (TPR) repeat protein